MHEPFDAVGERSEARRPVVFRGACRPGQAPDEWEVLGGDRRRSACGAAAGAGDALAAGVAYGDEEEGSDCRCRCWRRYVGDVQRSQQVEMEIAGRCLGEPRFAVRRARARVVAARDVTRGRPRDLADVDVRAAAFAVAVRRRMDDRARRVDEEREQEPEDQTLAGREVTAVHGCGRS